MNDRIKLVEAMGGPIWEAYIDPGKHPECVDLPDPFKDANDDYAVRVWLCESGNWLEAEKTIEIIWFDRNEGPFPTGPMCYNIGDYARAALEVIGHVR